MKITNIKKLKNNKYEIIIDKNKHVLYEDTIIKYNLLKPKEISSNELKNILDYDIFYNGYNIAIKYINTRLRVEKEIKDKLYKEHIDKNNINKIIKCLKDNNYLNDDKYLNAYIQDQINLTLNGPMKIINDLKKLGFDENVINKYLIEYDDTFWQDRVDRIINKKSKNFKSSQKELEYKIEKELIYLGYKKYNININFNENDNLKNEYNKLYKLLSKKYKDKELEVKIIQKLYSKGYDISKLKGD